LKFFHLLFVRVEFIRSSLCRSPMYVFGEGERTIVIVSGIHGDERNSVLASILLARRLRRIEKTLNGRVIIIPIANFEAFKYRRRCSMIDGLDMNRSFPGSVSGSPTQQHAWRIWERCREVDYIIDMHTCGSCIPYILAKYGKKNIMDFIEKIPVRYVVRSHGTRGQLFIEAAEREVDALILEVPQPRCGLDLRLGKIFLRKIIQTLRNLDFLEGPKRKYDHIFLDKRIDIASEVRGLFIPNKSPGDKVSMGEIIGRIRNRRIKSPIRGILLSIKPPSFVFCGEKVASIAPILGQGDINQWGSAWWDK